MGPDNTGLFCGQQRNPAHMDAVEFLVWLDTASEDEIRTFGDGTWKPDLSAYYNVFGRGFFDPRL